MRGYEEYNASTTDKMWEVLSSEYEELKIEEK